MVKIVLYILFLSPAMIGASSLQKACLSCHEKEGIPTDALYKRYLLKYSSNKRIKEVIFHYLKHPTIEKSIMPAPFIHKFGLQPSSTLTDEELAAYIEALIRKYDVKNQLYLP
jgi:hypothetical protein